MSNLTSARILTHKITRVGGGCFDDISIVGDTGAMEITISTSSGGEIKLDLAAARHIESAIYDQIQMLEKVAEDMEAANG